MGMKNSIILIFFLFVMAFFSNCESKFQPKNIKHVVIIGIDGMSVGGLQEASTPHFDEYIKNGAYSFNARNVLPTSSSPNWETMLTGSGVAQTGVTSNDWRFDNYNLPPVVTTENGRYPDIFYAIKRSNRALKTSAIYHWSGFANLYDKTNVDLDFDCENENETALKASEIIQSEKPAFLFIQLDHVDHAGHEYGHMTAEYFKSVELADQLAGTIIDATKKAGIFEETMFLIVADHGGVGFGHGDETVQGNEVPFILYGSAIKKGYKIPAAVNLHDVAATSAFALNVTVPQVWQGRAVACAFEGAPEPDPATLIGQFMEPSTFIPEIYPRKQNGEAGGLFVNTRAMVTMDSKGVDGKIRYTTDGSIPTVKSEVYTNPFEMTQSGIVKTAYFGNSGSQSAVAEGFFRVVKNVTQSTGVAYKLYKGKNWSKLPDFKSSNPIETGRVFEFTTDELADKMEESTGIVFDGIVNIENKGVYSFTTKSDDGSKLYVNGQLVVDNDGDHGVQEREGSINLESGKAKICVEYFNGGGGFFLNATYRGPGVAKQIISPEKLTLK